MLKKRWSGKAKNELFERLWDMYPLKRGKGQVGDAAKARIADVGEEHMTRCIDRFKRDMASHGRPMDKYMYGSTFFNSGYLDYLDQNHTDIDYREVKHDGRSTTGGNGEYPKLDVLEV